MFEVVLQSEDRVHFRNGGTDTLVVSMAPYKGEQRLDIRWFYQVGTGVLAPTQRGISLKVADGFAERVLQSALGVNGDVDEFEMDAREPLLVQKSVWKGKVRVDIRRHYWNGGELLPGKRGVSIQVDDGTAELVLRAALDLIQEA